MMNLSEEYKEKLKFIFEYIKQEAGLLSHMSEHQM